MFNNGLDGILFLITELKEQNINYLDVNIAKNLIKKQPGIEQELSKMIRIQESKKCHLIFEYLKLQEQLNILTNTKKEYLSYSDNLGFIRTGVLLLL
jgi:hypothetical protein